MHLNIASKWIIKTTAGYVLQWHIHKITEVLGSKLFNTWLNKWTLSGYSQACESVIASEGIFSEEDMILTFSHLSYQM